MPNPEHMEIIKQGVAAWNKWREQHPDIRPDLRAAADFRGWECNTKKFDQELTRLIQALQVGDHKREMTPRPKL